MIQRALAESHSIHLTPFELFSIAPGVRRRVHESTATKRVPTEPAKLLKKGDNGQDVEVHVNAMVKKEEETVQEELREAAQHRAPPPRAQSEEDPEPLLPFEQFLHGDSARMDVRREDDEKLIADETHSLRLIY